MNKFQSSWKYGENEIENEAIHVGLSNIVKSVKLQTWKQIYKYFQRKLAP